MLVQIDSPVQSDLASDLWVQDLARKTFTRIPIQGAVIGMVWSPDGQRVVHGLVSDGGFSLWERRSDGSGEPVKLYSGPDSRTLLWPANWTPDGKTLAFVQVDMATDKSHGFVLRQEAGSKQWAATQYLKSPTSEDLLGFSPDGKWALIGSAQTGRRELYVQRFTGDGDADARGGRVSVSTGGGNLSWWSPDGGKEIRYVDADNQVMSVQVKFEPTFSATEPKLLYSIKDLKIRGSTFAPDGRMMVVLQGASEQTTKTVGLVVNFLEELRTKVPVTK